MLVCSSLHPPLTTTILHLTPTDMLSPEPSTAGQSIPTVAVASFDEMVGRASMQETGLTGLADILNTVRYSQDLLSVL